MEFRPCIDIHQGKVKQIIGSTLNNENQKLKVNFVAAKDAAYFAKLYKRDDLFGGHIIMLDNSEQTKKETFKALESFPDGLQVGGGVTAENANEFLSKGVSQVIISSDIFTNDVLDKEKLRKLITTVGKNKIVLDLSCRKRGNNEYFVVIDKWQAFTNLVVNVATLAMLSEYCVEFLIHGVDVEGKKQGIDEQLLKILSKFQDLPVTYAGGIKNLSNIKRIEELGEGKINFTVGSALDIFGGDLSYQAVVNYVKKK